MTNKSYCWCVVGVIVSAGGATAAEPPNRVVATDYGRRTIYHSPQTPGYTCWTGLWVMPDGNLMATFKQATGPLTGRPRAKDAAKLGLDPNDPNRDYTGLDLANIYLRSTNGGVKWVKTAEDAFTGPIERPVWGGSHVALKDGSILRAVDGSQLPLVPDLPRRIFFQRSADLGKTWGKPEVPPEPTRVLPDDYVGDCGDCLTRVRRLRDGRLLATGVARTNPNDRRIGELVILFSPDDGKTWQPHRVSIPAEFRQPNAWNEWDSAELPDGRLLCVFRRSDPTNPKKQVRFQGVMRGTDAGWVLEGYRPAPFEHSGHPELLATREGVILHIATSGMHATADGGATWQVVEVSGRKAPYRSAYYPVSVQTADGRIFVASHVGSDNAYGARDQSIVLDTFRLIR